MSETQNILLNIYHPSFRQGYWDGRQEAFQEQTGLTDKEFVECLLCLRDNAQQWQEEGKDVYSIAGRLVGQLSASLFPYQPDEEDLKKTQEDFLLEVQEKYGPEGRRLRTIIQQQWDGNDVLARDLDAVLFARMLRRGAKPCRVWVV